jgi:hypothetical protein
VRTGGRKHSLRRSAVVVAATRHRSRSGETSDEYLPKVRQ